MATMIGRNSLAAILTELQLSGHLTWNQMFPHERKAPQPQEPEASAVIDGPLTLGGMMPVPFQQQLTKQHQICSPH